MNWLKWFHFDKKQISDLVCTVNILIYDYRFVNLWWKNNYVFTTMVALNIGIFHLKVC